MTAKCENCMVTIIVSLKKPKVIHSTLIRHTYYDLHNVTVIQSHIKYHFLLPAQRSIKENMPNSTNSCYLKHYLTNSHQLEAEI